MISIVKTKMSFLVILGIIEFIEIFTKRDKKPYNFPFSPCLKNSINISIHVRSSLYYSVPRQTSFKLCASTKCMHVTTFLLESGARRESIQTWVQKGTCIKELFWPPLEPKTENYFSTISFDWFIRNTTEV